jgi:hypothetical protein
MLLEYTLSKSQHYTHTKGMASPKDRSEIIKAIQLVWDSLDSHLAYSVKEEKKCASCGGRAFHAKCVVEYAEIILILSKQL